LRQRFFIIHLVYLKQMASFSASKSDDFLFKHFFLNINYLFFFNFLKNSLVFDMFLFKKIK
jgi:hypothetical protein